MSDLDDELADALAAIGIILTPDHGVGDLVNLMEEIELLYAGDLTAACEAIRTGQIAFEPIPDWWTIRRN
jgi:hypothetical protein